MILGQTAFSVFVPIGLEERIVNDLRKRLRNWGMWCNHDLELGPATLQACGLESGYIALDSGYVVEDTDSWDIDDVKASPDVADAEKMQELIRKLDRMEQYALAILYAGYPAVFRYRRIGDFVMNKLINQAEEKLLINKCFKSTTV